MRQKKIAALQRRLAELDRERQSVLTDLEQLLEKASSTATTRSTVIEAARVSRNRPRPYREHTWWKEAANWLH